MSTQIHPTAVVEAEAELDCDVRVGPYSVIGARVRIGAGTVIGPHVVVEGNTRIGRKNRIFQFASVGAEPQDLKYHGEENELIIGDGNRIRECVTIHPGTEGGGLITRIGGENLLMAYAHVAHDCRLGNRIVVANGVQLGGHVTVEDYAVLGALSGVHQFTRIGESAILGAGSMVSLDIPPFVNATGNRAELRGLNLVGLKRRGMGPEIISALKRAYRTLFQSGLKAREAVEKIRREQAGIAEVERFVAFVERSERGVCR